MRGRPREYDSVSQKMKVFRLRKKEAGLVGIRLDIPLEYKELLDKFCGSTNQTISDAICDLLDRYAAGCKGDNDGA
jgi:hypothetical protein